ncbi:MAG: hypothetical protein KBA51_09900, partial [Kiritimatiellae bacterium]|nr:hypothetical protein [Kiritimatiellia bacterium]
MLHLILAGALLHREDEAGDVSRRFLITKGNNENEKNEEERIHSGRDHDVVLIIGLLAAIA